MATTTRVAPVGNRLEDGFVSKIAFEADPNISLWEIEVTPPGMDVGDPIDTSTMFNTTYVTKAPGQLIDLTDAGIVCAYDPQVYDQIIALLGENGWVTVLFPDASTEDFIGYLRSFTPGNLVRNGFPTANAVVVCTNQIGQTETAPEYTAGGTP